MESQQVSRTNQRDTQQKTPPSTKLALHTPALVHPLLQLQRALGNQAAGRFIQAKLKISQPGDAYEQEADRVADQVMRMSDQTTPVAVQPSGPPQISRLQRKCAQCEEEKVHRQPMKDEEEERVEPLQAKEAPGQTPEVSPDVQTQINTLR